MYRWKKRTVMFIVLTVFCLAAVGAPALADEWNEDSELTGPAMVGDFFFLRPLGLAATILGTTFAVISLPFTHPAGQEELAKQKLIIEPAKFTFKRPLGQLP